MAEKTTKKNTKGTKKVTSKKTTATVKTQTAKPKAQKIETKAVEPKVVTKVEKNKKKGKCKNIINKVINNTPFAISLCVIVILIAILIFVLCIKKVPKNSNGEELLATINGKEITANELYEKLKESHGTDALINLIDEYISEKEVKLTDEDKKYVQEIVDSWKEQAESYDMDLVTLVANYGLTISDEKDFYNYLLNNYRASLALVNYIGDEASEDDLKDYYKNNYSDKQTVKHILIEVDSEAEDTEKAEKEAYDKAKALIKKLDKVEKDKLDKKFEELVEKNSDDTATYSTGGLIEDFQKTDVVEEFYEASSKLENGKYTSEPVKSTYGYHIILKVSSTPVEKYKDIKDEVRKAYAESLLSNDTSRQISKWDELRKAYKLKIEDDFIKDAYEKTIKDAIEASKTEE